MEDIKSIEAFEQILKENTGVLAYFSHEQCNVCKTLKPKLSEVFKEQFPKIKQVYIDVENHPEISAQHSIFTVPVIIVYFEGKETYRKARNVGVEELVELVLRPYGLMYT
jgi:thioredoxin-like negative regulator of GroEL